MSLPVIVDLDVYRGDSWSQVFRLSENGSPLDLTGSTVAVELRDPRSGTTYPLLATVGPDPGEFTVTFPDPTDPPPPGHYRWDAQETNAAGVVTSWMQGRFHMWRDVSAELVA